MLNTGSRMFWLLAVFLALCLQESQVTCDLAISSYRIIEVPMKTDLGSCQCANETRCQCWSLQSNELPNSLKENRPVTATIEIPAHNLVNCQDFPCWFTLEWTNKQLLSEDLFAPKLGNLTILITNELSTIIHSETDGKSELTLKVTSSGRNGDRATTKSEVDVSAKLKIYFEGSHNGEKSGKRLKRETSNCAGGCCLEYESIPVADFPSMTILAPEVLQVGVCRGTCESRNTLYDELRGILQLQSPCCQPLTYQNISLLLLTNEGATHLLQLSTGSATSCGCAP